MIWNSILAGIDTNEEAAEKRLASVDLDLVGWLDEAQRSADAWQRRLFMLLGDLEKWQEHLERQVNPEEAEKDGHWASLFKLPDEILTAKDPLKTVLDQHSKDADMYSGKSIGLLPGKG